eukprot:1480509-Rhodomonas_salina.1
MCIRDRVKRAQSKAWHTSSAQWMFVDGEVHGCSCTEEWILLSHTASAPLSSSTSTTTLPTLSCVAREEEEEE